MRVQVEATLDWLEEHLAAREAAGECNGFIAGPDAASSYTVGDLQLYCTLVREAQGWRLPSFLDWRPTIF